MDDHVLAGRYRLVSLLGRGGMGAVWRARDERLDREVAVKELRLPEDLGDDERRTWIARLDREARAAAGLKHPGIITVHDRVTGEDGRPWIVMELVHGRSLEDLLRTEGPLPPHRVARIGLEMLAALRAAHRAGITHRDIKPANVLLEEERVVLTDFGIAAVDGDATLTRTGAVIGTPAYMSPEQVRGQAATPASDLWSLGARLYTAVEGRPPFNGPSAAAVFVAVATEDPPPAGRAGPLEPTILELLRRDPHRRPSPEQLHDRLTRLTQAPATAPTAVDTAPPGPRPPRRRRRVVVATAAAALALVAGGAASAFMWWGDPSDEERNRATMRELRALGTPPGEERSIERRTPDRWRVTRTLCSDMRDCDVDAKVAATRKWLTEQQGVRVVHEATPPNRCRSETGCYISIETAPSQTVSGATISGGADGSLLLTFHIG
ncbi:serine/threonine-protein kinase [Spirillospora sp. CA-255316]